MGRAESLGLIYESTSLIREMSKTKSAWARDADDGRQSRAGRCYPRCRGQRHEVPSDRILVSGIEADEKPAGGIIQDMDGLKVLERGDLCSGGLHTRCQQCSSMRPPPCSCLRASRIAANFVSFRTAIAVGSTTQRRKALP
ncbi:hypothetical protein MPL3365_170066 [Mesorhizobium plurifarium]|uniref:Uncharacterized protein n=1 Tax=Mesorhizobium plurifarium TaxID=69974 RepID=A0A090GTC4_MESPL|nr:hypothetical protein MPL3365_170066 [Mesorhizobium plurifarium]